MTLGELVTLMDELAAAKREKAEEEANPPCHYKPGLPDVLLKMLDNHSAHIKWLESEINRLENTVIK